MGVVILNGLDREMSQCRKKILVYDMFIAYVLYQLYCINWLLLSKDQHSDADMNWIVSFLWIISMKGMKELPYCDKWDQS